MIPNPLFTFSKNAHTYDRYSMIQQEVFARLCSKIPLRVTDYKTLLDVGCGTGVHAQTLFEKYPEISYTGLDFSESMIAIAKQNHARGTFLVGDVATFLSSTSFDLVLSNATLQWVPHLSQVLSHMKTMISPAGHIAISMFGPQTFMELQGILNQILGRPKMLASSRFLSSQEVFSLGTALFPHAQCEQHLIRKVYPNLISLLRHIKYTGTNPTTGTWGLWTPRLIREIERAYLTTYRHIVASYHVFYLVQ